MRWAILLGSVILPCSAGAISNYTGHSEQRANGDVKWSMTANEMLELANRMAHEEAVFIQSLLDIKDPTVENVLMPAILRDNHVSRVLSEMDFYQYISIDPRIKEMSADFKLKARKGSLAFGDKVDILKPYRELVEKIESGTETLKPEYMLFLKNLAKQTNIGSVSPEELKKVSVLRAEIGKLEGEITQNINNAVGHIILLKEQLDGIPQTAIDMYEQDDDGKYKVKLEPAQVYPVLQYSNDPATRKEAFFAIYNQCPENGPLLLSLVRKRYEAAQLLGYKTHANFILRDRMAKDEQTVYDFMYDLEDEIKPIAEIEIKKMLEMKNNHRREKNLTNENHFYAWDYEYYNSVVLQKEFLINQTFMAEYFPTKTTIPKFLNFFENLFDLTIILSENFISEDVWSPDVLKYAVFQNNRDGSVTSESTDSFDKSNRMNETSSKILSDPNFGAGKKNEIHAKRERSNSTIPENPNSEFMGWLVLDIYAREGKYSHAAAFEIGGATVLNGTRIPAYAAVLFSVPPESEARPSLLTPEMLSVLFHEIGHAFHIILSKTETVQFLGTHVPMDFVECPSQVLEAFMTSPQVLHDISQHYQTGEKIAIEEVEKLSPAFNINAASKTLRQLYAAFFDMKLHTIDSDQIMAELDLNSVWNLLEKDITLLENNNEWNLGYLTFAHIVQGYDASYYSYLWSLMYALDVFETLFEGAEDIRTPGVKWRDEVLKNGALKNPMEYLTKLLGRPPSSEAFMNRVKKIQARRKEISKDELKSNSTSSKT